MDMKVIQPADLVDIQRVADADGIPLKIWLAYSYSDHPLNHVFREPIYKPDAKMWVHADLAPIVLSAAKACHAQTGLTFVLLDCLRTSDAQTRMAQTKIVRANPHWTQPGPGQLLSNPGEGAHPRGMAIDIMLEKPDGAALDMGTVFDHFTPDPVDNPAARDYPHPPQIMANRALLNRFMLDAASQCGREIWLLPSEWWDFRFKPEIYNAYAPLSDADLPEEMRMCD
jgi:D-alanyl-D-alanine dipeptidase